MSYTFFLKRIFIFYLDILFINIFPFFIFFFYLNNDDSWVQIHPEYGFLIFPSFFLLHFLLNFFYYFFFYFKKSSTPAHLLFGYTILNKQGDHLTKSDSLLRIMFSFIFYIIPLLAFPFLYLIAHPYFLITFSLIYLIIFIFLPIFLRKKFIHDFFLEQSVIGKSL